MIQLWSAFARSFASAKSSLFGQDVVYIRPLHGRRIRGYTMAELIIVLSIMSAAAAGSIATMQFQAAQLAAKEQAAWLKIWANEVQIYLVENYEPLSAVAITDTNTFNRALPGPPPTSINVSMKWPVPEDLQRLGYGNKLSVTSPLGGRLRVVVVNERFSAAGPNPATASFKPSAFVYAENPVNGTVEFSLGPMVGMIRQQIGIDGWAVLPTGVGAAIQPPLPATFPAAVSNVIFHRAGGTDVFPLTLAGYAGVIVGYRASNGDTYLRRDGKDPMTGPLTGQTANFSGQVSAQDASFSGQVNAQTANFAGQVAINSSNGMGNILGPNDNPKNYGGGLRTYDVIASGSVVAVDDVNRESDPSDGQMKPKMMAYMRNDGEIYTVGTIKAQQDIKAFRDITAAKNITASGDIVGKTVRDADDRTLIKKMCIRCANPADLGTYTETCSTGGGNWSDWSSHASTAGSSCSIKWE
jgi:prepilin-type N-terminal cleavage/methylation domain-containing protein